MKKLTKVLLIIITIFFISISITSCGKKEKIRYEYHEVVWASEIYNPTMISFSKKIIGGTNVTFKKYDEIDTYREHTPGSILYDTYCIDNSSFTKYSIDLTDTVTLGILEGFKKVEPCQEYNDDEIYKITPISNSDGINKYEYYTEEDLSLVIIADKETKYKISVYVDFLSAYEEIEVNKIPNNDTYFYNIYKIEGNNNVYYIENDFNCSVNYDYSQRSTNLLTLFTIDSKMTHFGLSGKKSMLKSDKVKLKITKAKEYNILDIIDDEGRAFIPGDTNEWVVVKVPDDLDYTFAYIKSDYEDSDSILSKHLEVKKCYDPDNIIPNFGRPMVVCTWQEMQNDEAINGEICIRKGVSYTFSLCPKVYFEINGKSFTGNDILELHEGDMIGVYSLVDGQKKYRAFNLRCNDKKRQNIVDYMTLSKDGPIVIANDEIPIETINYIEIKYGSIIYVDYTGFHKYTDIRNVYKVTNGEA